MLPCSLCCTLPAPPQTHQSHFCTFAILSVQNVLSPDIHIAPSLASVGLRLLEGSAVGCSRSLGMSPSLLISSELVCRAGVLPCLGTGEYWMFSFLFRYCLSFKKSLLSTNDYCGKKRKRRRRKHCCSLSSRYRLRVV